MSRQTVSDIVALCERVIVIAGGKSIFDGPLDDLTARYASLKRVRLTLAEPITPAMREFAENLGEGVETEGQILKISVPRDDVPARVTQLLAGLPVQDLAIEDVEIEAVIRDLFARGAE